MFFICEFLWIKEKADIYKIYNNAFILIYNSDHIYIFEPEHKYNIMQKSVCVCCVSVCVCVYRRSCSTHTVFFCSSNIRSLMTRMRSSIPAQASGSRLA